MRFRWWSVCPIVARLTTRRFQYRTLLLRDVPRPRCEEISYLPYLKIFQPTHDFWPGCAHDLDCYFIWIIMIDVYDTYIRMLLTTISNILTIGCQLRNGLPFDRTVEDGCNRQNIAILLLVVPYKLCKISYLLPVNIVYLP